MIFGSSASQALSETHSANHRFGARSLGGELLRGVCHAPDVVVPDRSQQVKRVVIYETVRAVVRRHRVAVVAALLVIIALVAGITVARRQAHLAGLERALAVQRLKHARELAQSALGDDAASAALADSTNARRGRAQDALNQLDDLWKEAGGDRALLGGLADAYEKIATVQGGGAAFVSGNMLPTRGLRDTAGAIASQKNAIRLREELVAISRNDLAEAEALANAYTANAAFYLFSGSPQRAIDYLQKALPIAESLLAAAPASESVRRLSGTVYLGLAKALASPGGASRGDTRSALAYMRGALKMRQALAADFPNNSDHRIALAQTYSALAMIYSAIGEHEEQLEQNRKALAVARALVASQPDHALYRRELAVQLGNTGNALVQLHDKPAALEHLREALRIYDELIAADANDLTMRTEWAVAHRDLGVAVGATYPAEALQHFQKAIDILAEIVAKDPKNTDFSRELASTYLATCRFQIEMDDAAAAVASAQPGVKIGEELAAASPGDAAVQRTLALLYTQLGHAHTQGAAGPDAESWRSAKEAYARALAIYEALKANGQLSSTDAKKPSELAGEIAKCDAALRG